MAAVILANIRSALDAGPLLWSAVPRPGALSPPNPAVSRLSFRLFEGGHRRSDALRTCRACVTSWRANEDFLYAFRRVLHDSPGHTRYGFSFGVHIAVFHRFR